MAAACLPLYTPTASSMITKNFTPKTFGFHSTAATARKSYGNSVKCKASVSSNSITDFDLYDLLGIDNSSDQSQIKLAYRMLQKRCHPDIAGTAGHDMAIILNEAYSILSDPNSRSAYDKEHAKTAELKGYTGKPIYSAWFGSQYEQRAVFVDEVKCVGCLKCALIAEKTFAIESVYGRARVIGQWADPEHKIQEAIEACPVDCISVVERSDLAALEFLMSKQPRERVGNAAGTRVSNIFLDVQKFQATFLDAMEKASTKETDLQREARITAIQAIRSISNWLYWQLPNYAGGTISGSQMKMIHISSRKSSQASQPNIDKLRDAAAARKKARESTRPINQIPSNDIFQEDYWTPPLHALPSPTRQDDTKSSTTSKASPTKKSKNMKDRDLRLRVQKNKKRNPILWGVQTVAAIIASVIVRLQVGEGAKIGGIEEHVGGSFALDIVNSSWLQVILAGITWFIIVSAIIELVEGAIQSRKRL